ncbi:MAG TPA: capsule assembly Wzi family protein [Cyclobacteriaceae bacterium]|nr:capsule assembly Wzi family protein [Cyclobacteriaceae bacterium]
MPVLDEALRRAQLIGELDLRSSLMLRPVNPGAAYDYRNTFMLDGFFLSRDSTANEDTNVLLHDKLLLSILPFQTTIQHSTSRPYGWGDGSMIPSRGFQQMLSAGMYAELGPLSIQFRPEAVWAQNKDYERFPQEYSDQIWSDRYYFWSGSDNPELFGEGAYWNTNLGQSSVRLNFGSFSIGASNENIWWGPGQFNAIIFSNNAPGFKHLTFNTFKPVKTFFGNLEGQLIVGRLEGSGFPPESSGRSNFARPDDWRYLNGINVSYSPKWIRGLYLGFSRTFQQYSEDMEKSFIGYFPIFDPFQKEKLLVDGSSAEEDDKGQDQQVAISVRWVFQEANAEVYFEFGRRDHALNWRDFIMSPEHARAYLFGFNKLFALPNNASFIQLRSEFIQTQQSINIMARYQGIGQGSSWGQHFPVYHGFTHYGQQLGIGLGPGNNAQTFAVSWVKDFNKLGVLFERMENQMDFYNRAMRGVTPHRPWVDLSIGLVGNYKKDKLLFHGSARYVHALNYQWQYEQTDAGNFRGVDKGNIFSSLGLIYLF